MSTSFVFLFLAACATELPSLAFCARPRTHTWNVARGKNFFFLPHPLFQPSALSYQLLHCITPDLMLFFQKAIYLNCNHPDLKETEATGEHSHFFTAMLFVCAVITLAAVCNGVASGMCGVLGCRRACWLQSISGGGAKHNLGPSPRDQQ